MAEDAFEQSPLENTELQDKPVFNLDGVSYAMDALPEAVTILINDLLRFNQEQGELNYRLRTLQAAQQTYVALIKQELEAQGVVPLASASEADDQIRDAA